MTIRQRQVLTGASGTATGTTVEATGETGEPTHYTGSAPTNSIWYSWTAPSAGIVRFDTCGSEHDTVMAAYTGTAVNALPSIGVSNDQTPACANTNLSAIGIIVSSGTTYRIAVDGYASSIGPVTLTWTMSPPAPANDPFPGETALSLNLGHNIGRHRRDGRDDERGHAVGVVDLDCAQRRPLPGKHLRRWRRPDTDFDTRRGIYTGSAVNALSRSSSNDDANPARSHSREPGSVQGHRLDAVPHVRLSGFNGDMGPPLSR